MPPPDPTFWGLTRGEIDLYATTHPQYADRLAATGLTAETFARYPLNGYRLTLGYADLDTRPPIPITGRIPNPLPLGEVRPADPLEAVGGPWRQSLEVFVDDDAEAEQVGLAFGDGGEGETDREASVVEAGGDAEGGEVGDGPGDGEADAWALGGTGVVDQWGCGVDGGVGDRVQVVGRS